MRAFDIGRLFSQQSPHLLRIAINHLCMNGNEPTARSLFDDLQRVPIWTRLLVGRRSASPPIFGDLSPRLSHRLSARLPFPSVAIAGGVVGWPCALSWAINSRATSSSVLAMAR